MPKKYIYAANAKISVTAETGKEAAVKIAEKMCSKAKVDRKSYVLHRVSIKRAVTKMFKPDRYTAARTYLVNYDSHKCTFVCEKQNMRAVTMKYDKSTEAKLESLCKSISVNVRDLDDDYGYESYTQSQKMLVMIDRNYNSARLYESIVGDRTGMKRILFGDSDPVIKILEDNMYAITFTNKKIVNQIIINPRHGIFPFIDFPFIDSKK